VIFADVDISWSFIFDNMPLFMEGIRLTIFISLIAFAISMVGGLAVALLRMSPNRIIKPLIATYINIFRAIPLLVFILFVYYGIAISFDLRMTAIQAGVMALSLQYSAWLGEIFRGGIQAVPPGQREAALSLGMSRPKAFLQIVLPQAFRISIPPTGNMFIGMIKDSSLVYLIGVPELLRTSLLLANRTFRYFEVYLAATLLYLVLTTSVYFLVKWLERKYAHVDVLDIQSKRFSMWSGRRTEYLRGLQERVREEAIAPPPALVAAAALAESEHDPTDPGGSDGR
jgi:polar amino acid transport system permease protein